MMKTLFAICLCSVALTLSLFAQRPIASQPGPSPVASVDASASPGATAESDTERAIKKRHKKHFNFTMGDNDVDLDKHHVSNDDIPEFVIPIVAITLLTVFGAPVLIVAVIMYFGFSKNRMMHRTVRMMVEKGQPVPEALLNPPPAQRQRSDMRRGVVLLMVGAGIMLFLGATNDWEGGAWALGVIPFLMGAGYLLVWKLEGRKDIPPPLP